MDRKLKRREFLKVSSVALLGAVAVACAPQPTAMPTEEEAPAAEPTKAPVAEAEKPQRLRPGRWKCRQAPSPVPGGQSCQRRSSSKGERLPEARSW
jgi:hypothetical protein